MPPKSNTRREAAPKNKIVTKRLLTISLILDDYVYKHTPISAVEAQAYIDEIATYRLQCSRDERSLQVIEKLTRCMTAIINEQQESHMADVTNASDGGTHTTYCPSPVYSLADEDKTQYNENTISYEEIVNTHALKKNEDEIETIDLTYDDNCRNPSKTVEGADAFTSIYRSMSNMSIRCVEYESPLHITSVGCSQSIIDNSKHHTTKGIENTGSTSRAMIYKDPLHVTAMEWKQNIPDNCRRNTTENLAHVLESPIFNEPLNSSKLQPVTPSALRTFRKIDSEKFKYELRDVDIDVKKAEQFPTNLNTGFLDIPTTGKNDQNVTIKQKRAITKKFMQDKTIVDVKQNKKTRPRNKNTIKSQNKENKPIIQRKKYNTGKNKKQITTISDPVQVKTATPVVIKETDIETVIPVYRINSDLTKAYNVKSVTTDVLQTLKTNSNEPISIYNKNTENDLSWLENIRYVREINSDEYDSTLSDIANDFWANSTLPSGWNDQDFHF